MKQEELSKLTDQELLEKAKKLKSNAIINAVLIGFLAGIIIYSIAKNGFGFFMLIPLFFIYQFIKSSRNDDDLKKY